MSRTGSFTDRVRKALAREEGREIAAMEIANRMDLGFGKKYTHPLYKALAQLVKQGEAEKVRPGVYRPIRRADKKPELQQVMWRLLRASRRVTVEDLQEIAGATVEYAREWLDMLIRQGVVKNLAGAGVPGIYQLINDTVDMPADEAKRVRLKRIRLAKREALAALTAARIAVMRAEEFVKEMGD